MLAAEVWGEVLAGLSGEQIANGLKHLPKDFPPTPMAFRSLCVGDSGGGLTHNTAAYKPFERDASATRIQHKQDKSAGRARMAELKALIK